MGLGDAKDPGLDSLKMLLSTATTTIANSENPASQEPSAQNDEQAQPSAESEDSK